MVCWYVIKLIRQGTLLSHVQIGSQDCVVGIMSKAGATNDEAILTLINYPPKPVGLTRPDPRII